MRNTGNLGLALYDASDKMNITGSENSLNHNMEIIDAQVARKMEAPETGEAGQVLTKTEQGFAWQAAPTSSIADMEYLPDEECGVNVMPNYTLSEKGYHYKLDGLKYNASLSYYAFQPMIPVIAGQTYRFTTNGAAMGISSLCYWYDAEQTGISECTEVKQAFSAAGNTDFVAPEGACYLGLSFAWGGDWASKIDSFMRITSISNAGEYVLRDMRLTDDNLGTAEPFKSIRRRTIVTLGDSIFGYIAGETGVSNLLADMLGCTVINGAFGGTRAIRRSDDSGYDDLDFTSLVDAIVAKDYAAQEAAVTDHSLPEHIQERLASLKTADFDSVDVVTMNYGTNDYTGHFVRDSFISGYKEAIGKLQAAYPQLEVVLITPTYRMVYAEDGSFSEDGDSMVKNGVTLPDVVDAVKEVAQSMHVRCIDAYNIGIGKYNYMNYFGPTDGVHHAENGRRHLARHIARELW